jgi:hypothetical protein
MDKWETGRVITELNHPKLKSLPKFLIKLGGKNDSQALWKKITSQLNAKELVLKPRSDGCSAGVAKINSAAELKIYLDHLLSNKICIPGGLLKDHPAAVELPKSFCSEAIAEKFILTDSVAILGKKLHRKKIHGWIELSVGVLGQGNQLKSLTPSQTIASGKILSLEEKFQGGTGINFTPPPEEWFSSRDLKIVQDLTQKAASALGISGYARLDLFFNLQTKEVILIEANTLPALTPSTVIYHQAAAEKPAILPLAFLEKIIEVN